MPDERRVVPDGLMEVAMGDYAIEEWGPPDNPDAYIGPATDIGHIYADFQGTYEECRAWIEGYRREPEGSDHAR